MTVNVNFQQKKICSTYILVVDRVKEHCITLEFLILLRGFFVFTFDRNPCIYYSLHWVKKRIKSYSVLSPILRVAIAKNPHKYFKKIMTIKIHLRRSKYSCSVFIKIHFNSSWSNTFCLKFVQIELSHPPGSLDRLYNSRRQLLHLRHVPSVT